MPVNFSNERKEATFFMPLRIALDEVLRMNRFYNALCRDEGAYPIPVELKPNCRQARMLMGVYAGPDSELNCALQFMYQFLVMAESHRPMAFALKRIAQVDMQHMALLANSIHQLGEEPKYWSYRGHMRQFWNAGFVKYGRDMRTMIEQNLLIKYEMVGSYRNLIRRIDQPQLGALLERILLDEQVHINLLESMLSQL
jgi:bacterioferritin